MNDYRGKGEDAQIPRLAGDRCLLRRDIVLEFFFNNSVYTYVDVTISHCESCFSSPAYDDM